MPYLNQHYQYQNSFLEQDEFLKKFQETIEQWTEEQDVKWVINRDKYNI